jgi:RNA polymerase sigma-70 factor (ECF subfamily)
MAPLNEEEIADAYLRYFPLIERKSRRMLRGSTEAQDLAQETFLRLWQSRLDLRDATATTAWLYRTCTRLAIDRLRASGRTVEGAGDLIDAVASPEAAAEDRSHGRRLLGALVSALPSIELAAAVLSRVDGLNHREIGEVLEVSERTVRRLLTRVDQRIAGFRARHEVGA